MSVEHDRIPLPIFTYVSDSRGTCAYCTLPYREGAMVVRVGVVYADGVKNGWRVYHLGCWRIIS